ADLRMLSPYTRTIRTYSSTGGVDLVPSIAAEFGMKVTVGIWLNNGKKDGGQLNEQEIQRAIELAKRNSNVNAIVVGKETILRGDMEVDDLIAIIKRVKRQVPVPVTTGETFDVWLGLYTPKAGESENEIKEKRNKRADDASKLAANVDFIAAHILPYWGGVPARQAVDSTTTTYDDLRRTYPGKRIVIPEFGWPTAG